MRNITTFLYCLIILNSCESFPKLEQKIKKNYNTDSLVQANQKLKYDFDSIKSSLNESNIKNLEKNEKEEKQNIEKNKLESKNEYDKLCEMSQLQLFKNILAKGSSRAEVKGILGSPEKIEDVNENYKSKTIFYYNFGEVIFEGNYVVNFNGYHSSIYQPLELLAHHCQNVREWYGYIVSRK